MLFLSNIVHFCEYTVCLNFTLDISDVNNLSFLSVSHATSIGFSFQKIYPYGYMCVYLKCTHMYIYALHGSMNFTYDENKLC